MPTPHAANKLSICHIRIGLFYESYVAGGEHWLVLKHT
jgi:hypothetical protein